MEIVLHLSMRIVVIRMTHVTLFEGWEISSYGNLMSSQEMGCNGNAMHSDPQVSFLNHLGYPMKSIKLLLIHYFFR